MKIVYTEEVVGKDDRSNWNCGPWDKEPQSKMVWYDEATGLPCMMHRNGSGAWCGYVGVAKGSKYFGLDNMSVGSDVHGGLTYSASCTGSLCHTPKEGEPKRWWLGFDCNHTGDRAPDYRHGLNLSEESYRDIPYVQEQCTELAKQLHEETCGVWEEKD